MTHSAIADARGIIIRLHTFGAMDPGASDHSAVVELDPVRSTPREGLILGPAGGLLIPESGRSLDMMPQSELRVDWSEPATSASYS